jgi:hypothetical protein
MCHRPRLGCSPRPTFDVTKPVTYEEGVVISLTNAKNGDEVIARELGSTPDRVREVRSHVDAKAAWLAGEGPVSWDEP